MHARKAIVDAREAEVVEWAERLVWEVGGRDAEEACAAAKAFGDGAEQLERVRRLWRVGADNVWAVVARHGRQGGHGGLRHGVEENDRRISNRSCLGSAMS